MKTKFEGIDYDFIEIGTSDFQTLIEDASDDAIGLSVEPISYYLNKLPNPKNVTKVQAALSNVDGQLDIYYIDEKYIEPYGLPWWVRGSNSINKPHPFSVQEIGQELYDKLVTIEPVPVISWNTLIENHKIKSIKYLKVDTEGHDHVILNAYLDICEKRPELLADRIKFECHYAVSNIEEIEKLLTRFKGYEIHKDISDYILVKKHKIPRVIHQTYSTKELPDSLKITTEIVKTLNPSFEYRFYDDVDCINFIKENYDQETLDLYLNINPKYGAARADFFRYLLMYVQGGVYLDVKSIITEPLENTLLDTDEFILTHWEGKDFAKELNYEFGEFQNWHIICKPGHPFLKNVIEIVKDNIRNFKGGYGKPGVLNTTGPIPYSQGILKSLNDHKTPYSNSPVREFYLEQEVGLRYMGTEEYHAYSYNHEHYSNLTEPIIINKDKALKAYVYYGNEAYLETIKGSIKSLREFSDLPVFVYTLNTHTKIDIPNVTCINWTSRAGDQEVGVITTETGNYFINREDENVYNILIERPDIVKHALDNFAEVVTYIDADSVAMPWVDKIFDMYNYNCGFPYFTTGIHDYLHLGNRGGAMTKEDLSTTLEHEACELFNVNQKVREIYRQTGYFVADQSCKMFLQEWSWMCRHPKILADFTKYAPYHEETILNVLFWKYNILFEALTLVYVNGSVEIPKLLSEIEFNGSFQQLDGWTKVAGKLEDIMFIHGEKRPEIMNQITQEIKKYLI